MIDPLKGALMDPLKEPKDARDRELKNTKGLPKAPESPRP